eukprot:768187-Hanusia_phi.AAC.5
MEGGVQGIKSSRRSAGLWRVEWGGAIVVGRGLLESSYEGGVVEWGTPAGSWTLPTPLRPTPRFTDPSAEGTHQIQAHPHFSK